MNFAAMAVFLRRELVCRHLRSSMSAMMSSALTVVSLRVNLVIALVVLLGARRIVLVRGCRGAAVRSTHSAASPRSFSNVVGGVAGRDRHHRAIIQRSANDATLDVFCRYTAMACRLVVQTGHLTVHSADEVEGRRHLSLRLVVTVRVRRCHYDVVMEKVG